jgi:site-specific recombinase XerD
MKVRGVFEKVRGTKVWWICYHDADGRKRREKAGRRGDAIALYHRRKSEALQGKKLPEKLRAPKVTFGELAKHALEYSKAYKSSYQHDQYRMAGLVEAFGNRAADSVTPQDFERWTADREWAPATANRYRALLSLVYRLGIANRRVSQNPARLIHHRRENNGRLRWLLPNEEVKLRATIESQCPEHLPEFEIALHTGMRRSEQYRLTWDCVDLDRKMLTVPLTKNGEVRQIELNSAALRAFSALRERCLGSGRVFVHRNGQPLVGPRCWFDGAVANSGLSKFTWHCIRHTFASRLVMNAVDLRTVQELMGHKTISMTCRYAHLAASHKLAAVERLVEQTVASQEAPSDTTTDTDTLEPQPADQIVVN